MPLSMVSEGEKNIIKKVGGREDVRRFLESLGFVTVVSKNGGNVIVNVKASRIAVSQEMANRIMV